MRPDSTRHQKTLDERDDSWNQSPTENDAEYAEADLAHVAVQDYVLNRARLYGDR